MRKFKKGDRIIVDEDDFCGGYKAGDEFEVIHCDGEVVTFIDRDGDTRYLRHGRIKPVPVAEATGTAAGSAQDDKPKFKVGDRVRTDGGYTFDPNEGVITSVNVDGDDDLYTVSKIDHPHTDLDEEWSYRTDDLSPVAVADQPQLTIQAGRYYRTRDGRKVGPIERYRDYEYPWCVDGGRLIFSAGGRNFSYRTHDLIAEWPTTHDKASTAGFTIPEEAYRQEPDTTLSVTINADTSALDAEIDRVKRRLKKLAKRARKLGIDLDYDLAA